MGELWVFIGLFAFFFLIRCGWSLIGIMSDG